MRPFVHKYGTRNDTKPLLIKNKNKQSFLLGFLGKNLKTQLT